MWMTKQLTGTLQQSPETGRYAFARGAPAVSSTAQLPNVPVYAPYGVAFSPPAGSEALLLPVGSRLACIGTRMGDTAPAAGELLLYSMGGARILLKNNGDIQIGGVTVTADGRVLAKAFETQEAGDGGGG